MTPLRCTPGMGTDLEVQVLSRAGHSAGREAQGRKGDRPSEGSVERARGPMDKDWIGGAVDRGERAMRREASVTKGKRRRSGGRAGKVGVLIREISSCT
jgi:hypothetical protein